MGISPYLASLRQKLGHQLVLMPAVAVLILDDFGRVLLVKQADNGQWGTVGGAVDPDESPAIAAVREAQEEAGLDIRLTRMLDAFGGPQFRVRYPNGDEVAYVTVAYEAKVVSGEPRSDGDETIEVGFFSRDELPSIDLSDFAHASLRYLGWIDSLEPTDSL